METLLAIVSASPVVAAVTLMGVALLIPICAGLVTGTLEDAGPGRYVAALFGAALLAAGIAHHWPEPGTAPRYARSALAEYAYSAPDGAYPDVTVMTGFNCERYRRKDRGERSPQRDLICEIGAVREADREMSSHLRALRDRSPAGAYPALTAEHRQWLASRDSTCTARWRDTRESFAKRRIGKCLLEETRRRTAQLQGALAALASHSVTAEAAGR